MKKINRTILYFILTVFLYSCGGMSDVGKTLRNDKIRTTDEFLVKKREPLTLPPDYKNLPENIKVIYEGAGHALLKDSIESFLCLIKCCSKDIISGSLTPSSLFLRTDRLR